MDWTGSASASASALVCGGLKRDLVPLSLKSKHPAVHVKEGVLDLMCSFVPVIEFQGSARRVAPLQPRVCTFIQFKRLVVQGVGDAAGIP